MQPTFPLLRLPNEEHLAVLRQMGSNHLFLLSLLSKRAKILVTSANRKAKSVFVLIERKIQFLCPMFQRPKFDMQLHIWRKPNDPPRVRKPKYVEIFNYSKDDKTIECVQEEYEIKDWLAHLCQVFHRKYHDIIIWPHASRYDFDSVYEHFKNPGHLHLHTSGDPEFDRKVLKKFVPRSQLSLNSHIFPNGRAPENIIIQNHEIFYFYDDHENMNVPLNDLLCNNSREIITDGLSISQRDLNKFPKLWIRGSNPRLQRLRIGEVSFNYDDVLRGIQHFVVPDNQEKVFKASIDPLYDLVVIGGREMRRMDGTVARIVVDNQRGFFNFFIWHDYNCCCEAAPRWVPMAS
ncbi:unnamed protein product [Caenorhabditis brenneri]